MLLTKRQISKLNKVNAMLQQVLRDAERAQQQASKNGMSTNGAFAGNGRRSAIEAQKMREDVLAKRAKGVSAASLADKYGVSTAYIYMIKE